ncbi:hypothetical protein EOJ36_10420 [Sandaracinomonas limnophila]|uniref:Carbohydrate kinase PfkB domain-containing protein n=2 Tax=Sandaracinomonas limnophila TaxID=1862386 RepID=A0A437PMJ3_9BACT|nr:hypothetical protein EOJ36_10420 [Sandaracinomonas limnophila]
MDSNLLEDLLQKMKSLKIAVLGDFALDFYFNIQTQTSEISIETQKEVHHGSKTRTYLGAAGNVCKNLAHLGIQTTAFGIIGNDIFGREIIHQMNDLGINSKQMLISNEKETSVYSKPIEGTIEQNRIDFGTTENIPDSILQDLVLQFCLQINSYDGVILNEQFLKPLLSPSAFEQIQVEIKQNNKFAIADLRSQGALAKDVILKINWNEFANLTNCPEDAIDNLEDIKKYLNSLLQNRSKGILLTLGEKGIIYADKKTFVIDKAIPSKGEIDTVGAGDMVVAAFTAAMLAGATEIEACQFANLCAHISIHKIGETGSATTLEIMNYEL